MKVHETFIIMNLANHTIQHMSNWHYRHSFSPYRTIFEKKIIGTDYCYKTKTFFILQIMHHLAFLLHHLNSRRP